jgi:CheY-like chemotaxis protein
MNADFLNDCVLVVEDEGVIAELYIDVVEAMGLTVCGVADTAADAISLAIEHRPNLILMDVRLKGDDDGVFVALTIHEQLNSKIIYITGSREPENVERIKTDRPAAILFKPLFGRQLRNTIVSVLGQVKSGATEAMTAMSRR